LLGVGEGGLLSKDGATGRSGSHELLLDEVLPPHVLSSWEPEACENLYGIPRERIEFIPWPVRRIAPGPSRRAGYVFASEAQPATGRRFSLLPKERRGHWSSFAPSMTQLVSHERMLGRATILTEIPFAHHDALMANASVYALTLSEMTVSSGQIRLTDAIGRMTPVVATK